MPHMPCVYTHTTWHVQPWICCLLSWQLSQGALAIAHSGGKPIRVHLPWPCRLKKCAYWQLKHAFDTGATHTGMLARCNGTHMHSSILAATDPCEIFVHVRCTSGVAGTSASDSSCSCCGAVGVGGNTCTDTRAVGGSAGDHHGTPVGPSGV